MSSVVLPEPGRPPEIIKKRPLIRYAIGVLAVVVAPLLIYPRLITEAFSANFLPHAYCFLYERPLVMIHAAADTLIGLSYVIISFTLAYLVHRARRDIPFSWVFIAFGLFIIACGMTHFMGVWTLYQGVYWLSANVKILTAVASVATAVVLPPQIPKVLHLIRTAKLSEERRRKLEVANRELEAFSYSVSHDLRSPLRTIDGFSQLLLEEHGTALNPEAQDYLRRVRGASQRMASLIDALLELSRVNRAEMHVQQLDLSAMAQEVAAAHTTPERNIEWRVTPGLQARGDARLIRAVLDNLLGNAVKFTARRPQSVIQFGSTEREGRPVFFVRDNGAGFDMAYAEKLFQPFQRLHAVTDFAGSGVGLATVQRILLRHGGNIWAESAPDQGATFYFTLNEAGKEDDAHA